jgi:hypothetical protein
MVAATLGWIGTTGTFVAYFLLSRGRVGSESVAYAVMNAAGGLLAGAASVLYEAWPSAVSNFVWAAIGLQGMAAAFRRRGQVPVMRLRRSSRPERTASGVPTACM